MSKHVSYSSFTCRVVYLVLGLFILLPTSVFGDQILQISSFSTCIANPDIMLNNVNIEYNQDSRNVTFNLAGTSVTPQNVSGTINVIALGKVVYSTDFNPCDPANFIPQLCPGAFSASGSQAIPSSYTSMIPAEAFSIPDIPAQATLELKSLSSGKSVACIVSDLTNGKSVDSSAVSIVAGGIAAAALLLSAVSALSAAGGGDVASNTSPGFTEVVHWFQGLAMNGMLSVNYPAVYRSFTKNFAFSTGIISSTALQSSLDSFRAATGGNLTNNNVQFLQNATLVFDDSAPINVARSLEEHSAALMDVILRSRDITSSLGFSQSNSTNTTTGTIGVAHVSGIQAYVEQLSIPGANSFMTLLLVLSIIIIFIIIGILLFKLILEAWALCSSFPRSLMGFRQHYWGTMLRTIVNLILLFQSVWILYCLFQFTHHESWAATLLAGVTLAIALGMLIFYSISIYHTARSFSKIEGNASALYDDKDIWLKYSLFYDSYKKKLWWFFLPTIGYALSKGCILAALDGHGLAQTMGLLAVEVFMFVILLWTRPYERRSGNIVNIAIQVVRVISMVCILIFVNELGVQESTQTILGFVLVIVQAVVTILIALLLVVNAFILCCKKNPHRQRRKDAEKLRRSQGASSLEPLNPHDLLHAAPGGVSGVRRRQEGASYVNEPKLPLMAEERHLVDVELEQGRGYR